MGLSLKRIKENVRDLFDANTASDQAKRMAVGQPQFYQQQQAQRQAISFNQPTRQVSFNAPQQNAPKPTTFSQPTKPSVAFNQPTNPVVIPKPAETPQLQARPVAIGNQQITKSYDAPMTQADYNKDPFARQIKSISTGIGRSLTGTVQSASGLVDAISPGKGTSQFTKNLNRNAEGMDKTVKDLGLNNVLYKGGQIGTDVATFLLPGAMAPKGVVKGAQLAGKIPGATKATVKLAEGAKALSNSGKAGKAVVATGKYLTRPDVIANVATDTALNTGFRGARGQDISPGTVAFDAGTSAGTQGLLTGTGKLITKAAKSIRETPINQGGYFKNPFGKDIAQGLSKEQSDFINEYANMLENMGSGNGVAINKETGARISSNFRTPENKGKAMTKADWFEQARKDIESGKAAYGASEDYKQLQGAPIEKTPNIKKGNIQPDPLTTLTGQKVTLPQYNPKATSNAALSKQINESNQALINAAIKEAKAKGDDFNLGTFEDMNVKNLSQSDIEGVNLYLFGDTSVPLTYNGKKPTTRFDSPTPVTAPIEKTPTRAQAMNKVTVAASEAPKLKTPNDLLPNGTNETLATIDARNKLMFAKSEAPTTLKVEQPAQKPKVTLKQEAPTPPQKNVVSSTNNSTKPVAKSKKPVVAKSKDLNSYIDDIAKSQGIDTNYKAPEMFAFNKGLAATSKAINKTPLRVLTGGKEINNLMQINPIRQGAQALENKVASVAQKANAGKGSKALNSARTVFAQTGISDADRQANRVFRDSQTLAGDLTKGEMRKGDRLAANLKNKDTDIDSVYRVVADDAILKRTHGDNARAKLSDLNPEARAYADQVIAAQKRTNEINYKIGRIDEASFRANQKTGHYARIFDIESKKGKSLGKKPIDTKPFEKQKDPAEFSDSLMEKFVKDPLRGALARQEIALRSLASHEFMSKLVKQGRLVERKPNSGYQQLTGKKYGKFDGMWADNTTRAQIKQNMEFESEWAKRYVGQLLDDFKASPLGKTQRVLKATKTVLNPGTNVQNVMSNILFFNRGSGVGVFRNATGMARAAKDLVKARNGNLNAELIQAKKLGVFGNDSGKAMVGDLGAPDLASIHGKENLIMKGLGVAEDAYGGADNAAKLGLWRNLQRKGLSPEAAAQQVQKFTQDYHNVGRIIGAMADAPVLGKPFARFIPELVRLTKNNVMYNPAGTIAGLAAIAYAGNALSEKAGETEEERKLREGQVGNTSLPGTAFINKQLGGPDRDISLNFAVGDSAVNIARAIGLNFPSEPGMDPNRALLEQLLPFEVPTRKDAQGNEVFDATKIVTNLGLRPLIELKADRNFTGNSIQDPENKTRVEGSVLGKTYKGDIPSSEKKKNIANYLASAYLPMGNEINSVVSAFKGEPNAMGKERTPAQALLRTVGIKTEKNDQATRDKRASTKEFFDGKLAQVNDFLNNNPDLKDQYLKLKSGTIDRATDKKVVDLVTPEKWQVITGDKSGRLFDQLKAEDEYQHQQDSTYPIDPIFNKSLSSEQRNQILQIRSSYSGDNIEQEEILRATKPWYQKFEQAERDRSTALSAYFDKLPPAQKDTKNERVKAYGELYDKYSPQQTPLMTKYYQLKDSNPDAAKALFKSNPELSDQFDAYKQQKLKYINEKRKIEGVPPIDNNTFNNITFGYEDDERKVYNELKYGKGYGGYGGYSRSSGSKDSTGGIGNPYKYAVATNDGPAKTTVKIPGGSATKLGVAKKAIAKPKVSLKKSIA